MAIKSKLDSLVPAREKFKKKITLLSGGYSMPEQIPGGEVVVYPWDQSVDDWILKNMRSIPMERIMFDTVKRLIDLPSVDEMVASDIVTILMVSRALARNSTLEYTASCPFCDTRDHVTVSVPDQLERVSEKGKDYPGHDDVTLPLTKDVVSIRPLLVRDEIHVLEQVKLKKVSTKMGRAVAALKAVNDGKPESVAEALEYLQALPPSDLSFILEQMEELTPHLGTKMKHKCGNEECGREFTHDLNIDSEFFR